MVVLAMIFTQTAFITTVNAADISSDGSYTLAYTLVENGDDDYLSITGFSVYPNTEYTLTIPATAVYEGTTYPVRAIADNAFSVGCTSTYTTKTVTYKKSTGYYNDLLKGVVFEGSNLQSIGANAFAFCSNTNFTELTLPDSVTTVGKSFNYCTRLESLTLGEGLALLPYQAIIQCNKLETVTVKADNFEFDNVGSIYVAKGMKNIVLESDSVTIPGLLLMFATSSSLDSYADTGFCFKVKNKTVYDALIAAGYTSDYVMYDLPAGTEFTVPSADGTYSLKYAVSDNGVTLNGFAENPAELVDLVIPATVTDPATGLTFNVTETAQEAFGGTNVKSAVVPGSINTFGTRLFKNCTNLESVELQEGITYLNFHMFYGCSYLTELVIPSTVTSIDFKSMEAAHNLATVKILGENVTFSNKILSGKNCGGTVFYVKNETVKAAVEACADNTNATYFNRAEIISDETDEPETPGTDVEIAADIALYESKWAYDAWNVGGLDIRDTLYYSRKDGSATISVDREDLASTTIANLPAYITNASLDIVCKNQFLFANGGEEINLDIEFNDEYTGSRQLDNMLVMLNRAEDKNANGNMTASGTFTIKLSYSTTSAPDTFISVYSATKDVTQYYTYLSLKNISNIANVDTLRLSVTYSGSKFSICEVDVNMKDDPYGTSRTEVQTEITPVKVISDGMVMQRDIKNTVWGTGGIEGETLTVKIDDQVKTTTVTDGKWSVEIDPIEAGGPYTMELTCGTMSKTISDIWFGEVWLAGGQSNMARSFETLLGEIDGRDVYYGIDKTKLKAKIQSAVDNASDANTRFFTVATTATSLPYYNVRSNTNWLTVDSTNVLDMSAVCYYYAEEMRAKFGKDMPIGIVIAPVPGSPLQGWVSNELIESDADYAKYKTNWTDAMHYNSMIYPLADYNFKGVLWYQGESNVSDRVNYEKMFPQMVELWRNLFDSEDLPFIITQLAPYTSDADYSKELFREVQLKTALNDPNIEMVVITDSGDPYNIHPMDKSQVGLRLAKAAWAMVYGGKEVYRGPLYKSMKVSGNQLILSFDHIGSGLTIGTDWGEDVGLVIGGDTLDGFEISADGTNFVEADAVISGNTVVVSADGITNPVAVRYGWNIDRYSKSGTIIRDTEIPTLYNAEGFPAVPFRAYATGFAFDVEYTEGNNAAVKINYTNKNTINSVFAVAVYYNSKLESLKYLPTSFDYDGATLSTTYNVDLSSYADKTKVNIKVFAFDGIRSAKPLAEHWNLAAQK